jgi:nucleoside-diphosphate-sugar epimerase
LCLQNKGLPRQTYIIAGEHYVTVAELVQRIADALHTHRVPVKIPLWLANKAAATVELSAGLLKFEPPLTRSRVKFFSENRGCDISKAKRELGYKPLVSLKEGLSRTVAWYKRNGYL